MKRYLVKENGELEECSPLTCHYHVEAENLTKARAKLCLHAARCVDNPPQLQFANGKAWRLITPVPNGLWDVESGRIVENTERAFASCGATVKHKREISNDTASFAHYSNADA